ncbi:hypothetical protein A2U01_0072803 [Trifolium medium]|uniref:Uncharacterized protein n=1 Tax=Trifolium medium TaxID=97028 RepID=A0A392SSC5_9FABA|nr:hypothetical protein [Trifolium medium]
MDSKAGGSGLGHKKDRYATGDRLKRQPPLALAAYLLVLISRLEVKSVVRRRNRNRPYQVIH